MADLKYSCRVLDRIYMFRSSAENARALYKRQFGGRKREIFSGRLAGRNRTETVIGRIFYTAGNIEGFFFQYSACVWFRCAPNYVYVGQTCVEIGFVVKI